jgi:hypothetical protein
MYLPLAHSRATARATAQQEEATMNTAIVTTTPTVTPFIQNLKQQQPQMSLATWLGPLRRFVLAHPLGR